MYSQNDYRNYLEHKWTWPNGNNSKEYNHHYYETHKEKWAPKPGENAKEWAGRLATDAIKAGGKWLYEKGIEVVGNMKDSFNEGRADGLKQLDNGTLVDPNWNTNPNIRYYDAIDNAANKASTAYKERAAYNQRVNTDPSLGEQEVQNVKVPKEIVDVFLEEVATSLLENSEA